jgi:hypothetical protein
MVFNIFSLTIEVRMDQKTRNNHKTCYETETCIDIDEMKERTFLRHSHEFIGL